MPTLRKSILAAAVSAGALTLAASSVAQTTPAAPTGSPSANHPASPGQQSAAPAAPASTATRDQVKDANEHVAKSLEVVRMMDRDPKVKALLEKSKGVFVIPDYGRVALVVGGQGGAGVLLVHHNGKWTGPAFYNFGGASVGAQAGVSAGQVAMILMDDKALKSFGQDNKFSLNADAGLTIVNYSARAHGDLSRGDVVVWSDTEGAFANLSVSVTDVNYDEHETRAYYNRAVDPRNVVTGAVSDSKAGSLLKALPG